MKKVSLASILAVCIMCPSFADNENITDENKGCTSGTLTVDSGTAALEADWRANTVGVTFYNGDTQYSSGQCTYDGTLTLPDTDPTKTGYTFDGWTVRRAAAAPSNPAQTPFDLSTLNASTPGIWQASHGSTDYCYYHYYDESTEIEDEVDDDCSESHVAGLSAKEWKTGFSYGTVKGVGVCSTTAGTTTGLWANGNYNILTGNIQSSITDETGEEGARYCWCKPTGYDSGNTGNFSPVASSSWVFSDVNGDADYCADTCANFCVDGVRDYSGFRAALFGGSQ